MVATALEQQVAAVVIAGDLFDGPVRDASAALWVDSQFRKLTAAGIDVVLIRGNHDALSNASRSVKWSTGVIELGAEKATSHIVDRCGLAIHGQSFGARAVYENIAAAYPEAMSGYFNIGMLHTSLAGSSGMTPTRRLRWMCWKVAVMTIGPSGTSIYAPNNRSASVHGSVQRQHARPTCTRVRRQGCYLVTVRDRQIAETQFISTDSVRWFELPVDVSMLDSLSDLGEMVCGACEGLQQKNPDRHLAVRVRFSGESKLHAQLASSVARQNISAMLAEKMREIGTIWLESVKVETQVQRAALPKGDLQLPLDTLREITDDVRNEPALQKHLLKSLEELGRKARGPLSQADWPLWSETDGAA